MKIFQTFGFCFLLGISLVSCDEITNVSQQSSTGGLNEILVVTNNVQQWNGEIGDSLRAQFTQDMQLLPVPEHQFNLVNVHESSLKKMIFKKHHSIFIVNIDPTIKEAFVESKKNLWAKPQVVIKINAPSLHEFLVSFEEIRENTYDLFIENERERISISYSSKFKNTNVVREINKYFHLDMNIPKGYTISKIDSNRAWIRKETAANSMNILIYIRDYQSEDDFNHQVLKNRRNALTSLYIPGPTTGSYQVISDDYLEPITTEISFNGMFAVEMRGLWRLENDFMGGPFLSYTFVDEKRNRLITIDGFMYAPKQKKAPLMRELEAILWSVKILD